MSPLLVRAEAEPCFGRLRDIPVADKGSTRCASARTGADGCVFAASCKCAYCPYWTSSMQF